MQESCIINIKNLTIGYDDKIVLTNVDFTINKGEFVYLIGKTASGKSSIIKTLYAQIPPISGEINVVGFDIKKLKKSKIPYLRRKIGIVFQDFQLLNDRTVYENLLFVLKATGWTKKSEIKKRITEVLDIVHLKDVMDKMPHQLSGGEAQRVVIARALLNKPELILADEPTGNLDPETSETIMNHLVEISNSGTSVFMATHNYNLIKKYPYRTLVCNAGSVKDTQSTMEIIDFDTLKI
ncbi:MAG: ATP-binding cassette domain-containing protein [Bacteroidales bacterium]